MDGSVSVDNRTPCKQSKVAERRLEETELPGLKRPCMNLHELACSLSNSHGAFQVLGLHVSNGLETGTDVSNRGRLTDIG